MTETNERHPEGQDSAQAPWRTLDIFRAMSPEALDELAEELTPVDFGPGDVLLRKGDAGDHMFLLDQGRVRVELEPTEDRFHIPLQAPAVVGEMSLVTHAPRTATVVAETSVHCMRLDRAQFNALVAANPMVAVFLTEAVGRRLLEADSITRVGKYQVLGRIGEGGAATVFEAMQPELGQPVALKMLSHSLVLHPGFAENFQREAQVVAGLNHDHVVRVLDTEHAYGTHFIVMERLDGNLLEDLIEEHHPLDPDLVREILVEVLDALHFAHRRGLLHRDIKPSNIFYTSNERAKVLDFGIAVEVDESSRDRNQRLGTPYYMSPEQILGRRLDARTDLYQVGITAYEALTGQVPYDDDTLRGLLRRHLHDPMPDPRSLRPDLPDDLVEFIGVCTARDPSGRFADAAEAARFLRIAQQMPLVESFDLTTVAICHHPRERQRVEAALARLEADLRDRVGVAFVHARRQGRESEAPPGQSSPPSSAGDDRSGSRE